MSFDPTLTAAAVAAGVGVGYLLGCIGTVTRSTTADTDEIVVRFRSPARPARTVPAFATPSPAPTPLTPWTVPVVVRPAYTLPKLVVRIDETPSATWAPPVAELRSTSCHACGRALRDRHRFCPECGRANTWER